MTIKELGKMGLADFVNHHVKCYFLAHEEMMPPPGLYDRVLREIEKPVLEQTLIFSQWNQKKASEILGINRNTLHKKMQELGIVKSHPDENGLKEKSSDIPKKI